MTPFGWVLAGWFAFGAVAGILRVGKPRDPITPGSAAVGVVCAAVLIVLVLFFGTGTGVR